MKREGELIILEGLEGNDRADALTISQKFLKPYLPQLEIFWSLALILTFLFLVTKFIVGPLYFRKKNKLSEKS